MNVAPISVVITTYNDYNYLSQAIESVLKQELLPIELLVVDDGSESFCAESIANQYNDNEQGVKVIFYRKENGGASSARNLGLLKASQPYIAFLDVDDKMLPDNLLEKYELIKKLGDEYFGVYGGATRSTGEIEVFPNFDGIANPDIIDEQNRGVPGGSPFFLFNKAVLIEVGGFDESIQCNEDYDLIIRLVKSNRKCKGSTGAGFYRNLRPDSLSRPSDPDKHFNRVMKFLEKAEKHGFYSNGYLNQRKMATYITYVKGLLQQKKFLTAFKYAREGFKYSKPITRKQKIVYLASLSFIKGVTPNFRRQ